MYLHITAAPSNLDHTIRRPRAVIENTDELSQQRLIAQTLAGFSSQSSLDALFPDGCGIDVRFDSGKVELFIPFGMTAEFDGETVSARWVAVTSSDWPHRLRIGGLWLDLMVTP